MQLTRDMFAIAKFLLQTIYHRTCPCLVLCLDDDSDDDDNVSNCNHNDDGCN